MTRIQFFKVLDFAQKPNFEPLPYLGLEMVAAFASPPEAGGRRPVTMLQAASQIYGEARSLTGEWIASELDRLQAEARYWDLTDVSPALPWLVWYDNGSPDGSPARAYFDLENDARAFASLRPCAEVERVLTW